MLPAHSTSAACMLLRARLLEWPCMCTDAHPPGPFKPRRPAHGQHAPGQLLERAWRGTAVEGLQQLPLRQLHQKHRCMIIAHLLEGEVACGHCHLGQPEPDSCLQVPPKQRNPLLDGELHPAKTLHPGCRQAALLSKLHSRPSQRCYLRQAAKLAQSICSSEALQLPLASCG